MPQALAGALYAAFGSAAFGWGAAYTVAWTITIAATVEYSKAQKRKARRAADAGAKDRELMIRSAIAPRRYVYGRDKISGPIAYMQSTGDRGRYLHIIVALAAHECDAIEKIYFNEVELPTPDGSGYITSGEFARPDVTEVTVHTGTTSGAGAITLPHNAQSISAAYTEVGTGDASGQNHYTGYAHTAGTNTVTGLPADTALTIAYTYARLADPLVRVRKYLGGSGQTADADLITESGGKWTAAHVGAGICYLYVRIEFDQEVFGSTGVPNISALVRGKKVYDPRTALTAWSNNAALCVADFLKSAEGFRALAAEVPDSEVIVAANICDEEIDLNLAGTDVQARYVCDYSYTSEQSPRDVLGDLLSSMAGRAVWTQGRWLVRAGAHRTPTLTITADMLAGQISVIPKASRSDLFNAVRCTYRDASQDYAEVQAPIVANAGYEAEDGGVQIVRQIDIPTLADTYRAQRLGKIVLERSRQSLTVSLTCNLAAYDLAPTDTVALTLPHYGWTAKVFEVVERTITRDGLLQYTLRETAAGVWDWAYGEATIGDLAPDTELPNPFGLPAILTNLVADEGAVRLGDGTIITQAVVTWDASPSPFVANGGSIQYQTAKVGTPWGTGSLPGDATSIICGPLQTGIAYVFRARAINAAGRAGDWAYIGIVAEGPAAPPDDVTGLAYEIKPGQVWLTWNPCDEADYAATELRYDGTGWDDATFLWRGAGSDYQHPRPPNGTYTVRAKHLDTSGNYSANASTLSVTVDDSIDAAGSGLLVLRTDRFPYFEFADGTTHTTATPILTITAVVSGLTGAVAWTATAYNASDAVIGTVTLSGTGNTRTMTGAQFTAPGSSGSVRYVIVEAAIGTVTDSLTVYRADPTVTVARLYLSNPRATVPTDAQGLVGNYADATTEVAVYEGITLATASWSIAITPDSGVTANINGGAGPVTGTTAVDVSVTDMTIPDGAVLVTATKGLDTLTASFVVTKSEASGSGYNVYFTPRSEILLPVNADGSVATYVDAWSELKIIKGGQLEETAQWTLSKVDTNVTSTLTGARVDVTALLGLGGVASTTNTAQTPYPSGWSRPSQVIYGGGVWLQIGFGSTTKVRTSTDDMQTWTERDTGLSAGRLEVGGFVDGTFVLWNGPNAAASDRVIRSSDGGVTWVEGTAMPAVAGYAPISRAGSYLVASTGSALEAYRSTDGASWSTFDPPGGGSCQFAAVGTAWAAQDGNGALHTSANSGTSWTAVTLTAFGLSNEVLCFGVLAYRGLLVAPLYYGYTSYGTALGKILCSTDGVTWTAYTTPPYKFPDQVIEVSGVLYIMAEDGALFYSTDGKTWLQGPDNTATNATPISGYVPRVVIHDEWQGDFLPALDPTSNDLYRVNLDATSASEGAVTVTATKTGQLPMTAALPVRKGVAGGDVYTFQANPGFLLLPATADGVVTDWTSASITARANKNGADDTANWSWTWTAANMTPASGSGATASFTAMSADTGQVTFRGAKAGQPDITGTLNISKAKGGVPSGPIVGGAFHVISTTTTWLGLKFLGNGKFQIKRGSGGSYADAGQWAGAVLSTNTSFWLRVSATGHSLDSGTTDTWLAMTTDREYVLSDATSGTHTTNLQVLFATDNTGANAVIGFGSLQLIVP